MTKQLLFDTQRWEELFKTNVALHNYHVQYITVEQSKHYASHKVKWPTCCGRLFIYLGSVSESKVTSCCVLKLLLIYPAVNSYIIWHEKSQMTWTIKDDLYINLLKG